MFLWAKQTIKELRPNKGKHKEIAREITATTPNYQHSIIIHRFKSDFSFLTIYQHPFTHRWKDIPEENYLKD